MMDKPKYKTRTERHTRLVANQVIDFTNYYVIGRGGKVAAECDTRYMADKIRKALNQMGAAK